MDHTRFLHESLLKRCAVVLTVSGLFLDQLRSACENAHRGCNGSDVYLGLDAGREKTMNHIRAIGFDLFNTLEAAAPDTLWENALKSIPGPTDAGLLQRSSPVFLKEAG